MAKFERFEEIIAWQKARFLVREIYTLTSSGRFGRDFSLLDQIRKAGVSIMANVTEGFARKSNKEFARFLYIAHGSVAEVQSHLYVALDQGYVEEQSFNVLYANCDEISKMISGLITYLESN